MSKEIKIGDLITAYHKGIHLVKDVGENSVTYITVANSDLKRMNSKTEKSCHIAYCKLVDNDYIENKRREMEEDLRKIEELIKFYKK